MKKTTKKTALFIPTLVEGRWYALDAVTGEIAFETSFEMKFLAEMFCANMMGLRHDEAVKLWERNKKKIYDMNKIA